MAADVVAPDGVAAEGVDADALPNEAAAAPIRLRDGLHFRSQPSGGRASYVCHDTQRGKYFHFGAAELEIARLLDGSRSVEDLAVELEALGVTWSREDIAYFLSSLVRNGLAEVTRTAGASAVEPGPPPPTPPLWPRLLSMLVSQRIPLFAADRAAIALTRRLHQAFRPAGVFVWCLLVASGLWQAIANGAEWHGELQRLFSPDTWPVLLAIWLVAKLIHESGHAVAARRHGIRVGNAGILFFMFAPLAYVDVTDAWRLPRRWARIQIALAGVYFELAIAAVAVWVWAHTSDVTIRYVAAQVAVLTGPATLLVNANPLLRLDGYYVLADLLGIPNLRMHGRRMVAGKCQAWLLGRPPQPSLLHGWQRTAALWHAVGSILFQIVWMGGLLWGILFWGGGLGIVIGGAAFLLWVVLPLARWISGLRASEQWRRYRSRLLAWSAALAGVLLLLSFAPSPLGRRIPVVVRYHDEQVARAASDGFVVDVPVRSGDPVTVGTVLVRMDDPQLRTRQAELSLDLESAHVLRRKLHNQGEHAMAAAESQRIASLSRQLTEINRQLDALTIRATRAGLVTSPRLETLQGAYLRAGDVVVRVGDEQHKELLASIHGADLQAYRRAVEEGKTLTARLRGGQSLTVQPAAPSPRASLTIPHPALVALAGGPIPLAASDRDADPQRSQPLASPHTESLSPLSAASSRRLRAGQQGMLIIGDNRSLMQRLYQRLQDSIPQSPRTSCDGYGQDGTIGLASAFLGTCDLLIGKVLDRNAVGQQSLGSRSAPKDL